MFAPEQNRFPPPNRNVAYFAMQSSLGEKEGGVERIPDSEISIRASQQDQSFRIMKKRPAEKCKCVFGIGIVYLCDVFVGSGGWV